MPGTTNEEFGKRRPVTTVAPVKRSRHVALLMMGTVAIGGSAYALMPNGNCATNQPGAATSGAGQADTGCASRRWFSGGGSYGGSNSGSFWRSHLLRGHVSEHFSFGASSIGSHVSHVTRGGFGSMGHGFGSHGSGGS